MKILRFKLEGKDDAPVDFEDFAKFSGSLQEVLRLTYRSLEQPGNLPRYRIRHLEIGSAVCDVDSSVDIGENSD